MTRIQKATLVHPAIEYDASRFLLQRVRVPINSFERQVVGMIKSHLQVDPDLSFNHACNAMTNVCEDKMAAHKQWRGIVSFRDDFENGMPVLIVFNVHQGSADAFLKLHKKKEVSHE